MTIKKLINWLIFLFIVFIGIFGSQGCASSGGGTIVNTTTSTTTTSTSSTSIISTSTTSTSSTSSTLATTTTSSSSTSTTSISTTTTRSTTTTVPSTTTTTTSSTTTTTILIPAPEGLIASPGFWYDKVNLTWEAVTGATNYKIYRSMTSGGSYNDLSTTTETIFDDTSSSPATNYYYKVSALISATESDKSSSSVGIRSNGIVFVSQNSGNDGNNGVLSNNAFQTINTALSFMQTGNNHTLKIAQGTYSSDISSLYYLNILSSSGLSQLSSLEGGYSDDFTSRNIDRVNSPTIINLSSNNFSLTRSGCTIPLKIEGFKLLSNRTSSSSTVYAVQLSDAGSGSYFNFCNNTISIEASGTGRVVALYPNLYSFEGPDVNRISNNNIWINAIETCSAHGISALSSNGSTTADISNIIIENNRIDTIVTGGTKCFGINGAGGQSSVASCVIKNNVITTQNNWNNSGAYAVNIFAQARNAQILNNSLIARSSESGKTYNVWTKTDIAQADNHIAIDNNILYPINTADATLRVSLFITSNGSFYPPTNLQNNVFINSSLLDTNLPANQLTTQAQINTYEATGYSGNLVSSDISSTIFAGKNDASLYLGNYASVVCPDSTDYIIGKGLALDSLPSPVNTDFNGLTRNDPPAIGAYEID